MKYQNAALNHRIAQTGLTQAEFAKSAQVSWGTVYKALLGQRISPRTAHKIAKALNATPAEVGIPA